MQFINYFSASIVCFLGLIIGMLLIRIAPEEQKPLEKYFAWSRKAFLLLIFGFLASYYIKIPFYLAALALYFIFLVFIEYKAGSLLKKSIIISTASGVLFFISSENTNLFAISSGLILLYNICTSSLVYSIKKKNYFQIIFYNMGFLLLSNILFLLDYHFSFLIFK